MSVGKLCSCDFNPRSREGSDSVSPTTHCGCQNFNPRSREGSDIPMTIGGGQQSPFQSTLP